MQASLRLAFLTSAGKGGGAEEEAAAASVGGRGRWQQRRGRQPRQALCGCRRHRLTLLPRQECRYEGCCRALLSRGLRHVRRSRGSDHSRSNGRQTLREQGRRRRRECRRRRRRKGRGCRLLPLAHDPGVPLQVCHGGPLAGALAQGLADEVPRAVTHPGRVDGVGRLDVGARLIPALALKRRPPNLKRARSWANRFVVISDVS